MPEFACYLHPETVRTSQTLHDSDFVGVPFSYFCRMRERIAELCRAYPCLPLRHASDHDFERVHPPSYLEQIRQLAAGQILEQPPKWSVECRALEHCLPGYRYGLGGMFEAIDRMRAGSLERAYCFSLGGHHAFADWGHGYCILNPLAAAARYAQEQGFAKVLIIDWDHHHGDGTQAIFAHDPSVYHISIHSLADLYMIKQVGIEPATSSAAAKLGHCNIPLLSKRFDDRFAEQMKIEGRFYRAHESIAALSSALANLPWKPDLICVFSGYDAHRDDCGAGISDWENNDFRRLARLACDCARLADAPLLIVHGGGYTLEVTLGAAQAVLEEVANEPSQST
jgi:acetoin utilization deacetylase AcuC-like enzyme